MVANTVSWDALNWKKIHYTVEKLQIKIAKATKDEDWERVMRLQNLVFNSYYCKLVAVRRVTIKKRKRTAGLDGKFWDTDAEKYDVVSKMDYRYYNPLPFKRIYVQKDHDKTKLRPLSIPVIYDRAMQALFLIALDPVIETLADKHAYGFRLYRNSQDAIRDMLYNFNFTNGNQWLMKADIKECFDNISHEWLMNNLIFDKRLLHSILTCGYIYQNEFHALSAGIPQGGVLSPVIVNFALTGFEKILRCKYPDARMIRYVDDFLFSAPNKQMLDEILIDLSNFLAIRTLALSPTKTEIKHITEGISFIGWFIKKSGNEIELSPTDLSLSEVWLRILHTKEQSIHWSPTKFVTKLNYIIRGWGNYHTYACKPHHFIDLDISIEEMLWGWLKTKYPKLTEKELRYKFFNDNSNGDRNYNFNGIKLEKVADIRLKTADRLSLDKNPYVDRLYFKERRKSYNARLLTYFN